METLEQKVNLSRVCRRGTKSSAIVVQSKDDLNNIIQNEIKPLSKGINVLSVLNHKAYNNNNKNNNITNNFPKKNNELITTVLSAKDNRSKRLPFIRKLRNACLSFNNGHAVLVILIVLLLNGGYATARPNLNSNLLDNIDKVNQPISQSLVPPATSLPSSNPSSETTQHGGHAEKPVIQFPIAVVEFARVETPFIIGVWILFASIAKIGFHMTPKIGKLLPESSLLIIVGVIIGIILYTSTSVQVSPLTPNTFFFYMLPPIILDAGYFMPNRLFFDNIGTILLMAVVGTIFNIATIGGSLYACGLTGMFNVETPILDTFLFASLISAVDPVAVLAVFEEIHVNEILYIVVFGESLLNDAVTVVLYHMFETYNEIGIDSIQITDIVNGVASFFMVALGGVFIGVIWGLLTGLVTRFTDHVRVIEPIFIFVMAYLAYLNAEIFHWSGILAITFCGITMKNYVEANISHKSHTTIKYALKMLSSSSETIIFMFLGVATVNNSHIWNTWFVILTIVFCSFFRTIGVIILTALANRFRIHKLSNVDQFVMSYGGLRGAVAFALVLLINPEHVPLQPMFVTTTIAVIYFTVFLQGITIKPLVKILNVKRAEKRKPTMNERIHERFIDHMMAGLEDIVGKTGNYNVRDKFKRFDNRFIRPYLIRDLQGAEPKILETYSKLAMKDAMDFMRRNPSTIGQMSGTESMSALFRTITNGSPSFSNLENSTRNLDLQELDYNPSKKDLTDAKIHHLLAEELKPYRRHRRLSYSRHAVDDRDLSTQVNYKMHMNIRRMAGDRKHHKRSKRLNKDGTKQNHVSFPEFQQNGSAKQFANDYINEVLHENPEGESKQYQSEEWEGGLTFTAKSLGDNADVGEDSKRFSRDSEGDPYRVATPTALESTLPWKREENDKNDGGGLQQNEFPAWASNKEYLAYNSPSATFLGGISAQQPKKKSVIGLFRRESSVSGGAGAAVTDSDSSIHLSGTTPARSHSTKRTSLVGGIPVEPLDIGGHSGQFPVTPSHRRNSTRLLDIAGLVIPEENKSHVKSASSSTDHHKRGQLTDIPSETSSPTKNPSQRKHRKTPTKTTSLLSGSATDTDTDDSDDNNLKLNLGRNKKANYDETDDDDGKLSMKLT